MSGHLDARIWNDFQSKGENFGQGAKQRWPEVAMGYVSIELHETIINRYKLILYDNRENT